MKRSNIVFSVIIISLGFLVSSCNKEQNNDPLSITINSATEITETGFTINWTVNTTDIEKIIIELSKDESMGSDVEIIDVASTDQTSKAIEGLDGATNYYFRINAVLDNGGSLLSDIESVITGYERKSVDITTADGISLSGTLKYLAGNEGKKPGIIFMHEMGAWINEWKNAEVVTDFIALGYVCLILEFRGHFSSEDVPMPTTQEEIEAFIFDVSNDLIAAVEFMKTHEKVDGENLSLVGASLGGIMSIAGNGYSEVKSSVALSGTTLGMYSIFPSLVVSSAFFIAGENDVTSQGVDFAAEAQTLFNMSQEPKKIKVIPNNGEHGTALLLVPGLNQEIIEWVEAGFSKNK